MQFLIRSLDDDLDNGFLFFLFAIFLLVTVHYLLFLLLIFRGLFRCPKFVFHSRGVFFTELGRQVTDIQEPGSDSEDDAET